MDFLDLSAASEEERRMINEILSDTSVVNISQSKKSESNVKNDPRSGQNKVYQPNHNPSVISMDMSTTQSPGYAIPPPLPFTQHVYGGTPIFQPYSYIIPYNLQPYLPYVLPTNQVVPTRPQQPQHHHQHQQHHHNQQQQQQPHQHQHQPHQHQQSQQQQQHHNHNHNQHQHHNHHHHHHHHHSQRVQQQSDHSSPQNVGNSSNHGHSGSSVMRSTISSENNHAQNHSQYLATSHQYEYKNNTNHIEPQQQQMPEHPPQTVDHHKSVTIDKNLSKPSNNSVGNKVDRNLVERDEKTKIDPISVNSQAKPVTKNDSNVELPLQHTIQSSDDQITDSCSLNQEKETIANGDSKTTNGSALPWSSSTNSKSSWADLFKRADGGTEPMEDGTIEREQSGSDNSEDDNQDSKLAREVVSSNKFMNVNAVATSSKENCPQETSKRTLDNMALRLAHRITSMNLKHSLPFLKPRGFVNKGNGCYINATLQALVACPPFYNLMKEIGDFRCFRRENSCTPILDSFAELFLNFPPLDSSKQKNKLTTSPNDQKLSINSLQADAIEPKCIYNVLGQIKSECLKGAQEDAEEFLSSVLNGLHEEMIGLGEMVQTNSANAQNGNLTDVEDSNDDITNDDYLWREVGPKNRSLPIRTAKVINTPIQEIFGGSLFSIRTAGKDRCGHRSPFFDLQLDISNQNVQSVQDAIKSFTATEVIHDFYCSKTRQTLDAHRRTSLDQLPPILILHLKQFVYSQDHGLKKLIKRVEYPIDLELPDTCLHEKSYADKNLKTSRAYKLLAVVYHEGKEAVKGHYLTDVYHIGSSQWIRCDDSNLKVIPSPRIENPDSSRTPYLLFYRRLNTLRAQTGNHDNINNVNKKKS